MPVLPTPLPSSETTTSRPRTASQPPPDIQPERDARRTRLALANGDSQPGLAFIQQFREDNGSLHGEIVAGLQAEAAFISPKFFYDVLGSRLFECITELPEYYPTRTEAAIFARHAVSMVARAGRGSVLIDLGAGNCQKAARLFPTFQPSQYVALDISVDFLRGTLEALQQQHPRIPMLGLGADLSVPLDLPAVVRDERRLFFYPGSSIGNFAPPQALALLQRLRAAARPGDGLLIGIDLVKDAGQLVDAYDDALGVTAAFNRNVLRNLNRIVGSNFALGDWRHVASFDREASRIQMHLEATRNVPVTWKGGARTFAAGERIHTEDSHKYRRDRFAALLASAGFSDPLSWSDPDGWFAVFHARA